MLPRRGAANEEMARPAGPSEQRGVISLAALRRHVCFLLLQLRKMNKSRRRGKTIVLLQKLPDDDSVRLAVPVKRR